MQAAVKPHAWSRDFAWTPRRGPFVRLGRDQVAHYDARGFTVVPDALAPEPVAELCARLDPLEAEVDAALRGRPDPERREPVRELPAEQQWRLAL